MTGVVKNIVRYRELMAVLVWKAIVLRYKQAYFGVAWSMLKPIALVLIFMLVRSFVGIDTGDIPYPLLTYCALMPWIFFQESASDGVGSVVNNATLIRKIYFPREIFPLAAVFTKVVELGINFVILAVMMAWFGFGPKASMVWVPLLFVLTMLASLTICFAGAAMNVYYRDMSQLVPLLLSILMYATPVIYPLALVHKKLLEEQAAGEWSGLLYTLYSLNPLTGIIDGFQRAMLVGAGPDWATLGPGLCMIAVGLPVSYAIFKRAEAWFADVI
jgi:lipopolysaccharide transport system permease protein